MLPQCYNVKTGDPGFDWIELYLYQNINTISCHTVAEYMQNVVVPLLPVECTISTSSPSINAQISSITQQIRGLIYRLIRQAH